MLLKGHNWEAFSWPFCLYGNVSAGTCSDFLFPLEVAPPAGGGNSGPYQPMTSCCMTPTRTTGTRPGWTPGGDGETSDFSQQMDSDKALAPCGHAASRLPLQVQLQKTCSCSFRAAAPTCSDFTQQRCCPQLSCLHDHTLPGLSEVRQHQRGFPTASPVTFLSDQQLMFTRVPSFRREMVVFVDEFVTSGI